MDNKCEELLADSVINNRYPNKAKQIYQVLIFLFHKLSTPLWKTLIKTFMEKMWKSLAHKKDTN